MNSIFPRRSHPWWLGLVGFFLLWLAASPVMAQHIYQGGSTYNTTLYTWDGRYLYQGSTYNATLCTIDGKHVYQGRSKYGEKLLTFDTPIPVPVLYIVLQL